MLILEIAAVFVMCAAMASYAHAKSGMTHEQAQRECRKMFPDDKTIRGGKRGIIIRNCVADKMRSGH